MPELPRISDAEWEVMKVVWDESPITANSIVERLSGHTDWKPKTVKTLINRLVQKKALGYEKKGREYLFHPLVKETESAAEESRSFVKRVFRGALTPMLAHFVEKESLTQKEIEELRDILNRKEKYP